MKVKERRNKLLIGLLSLFMVLSMAPVNIFASNDSLTTVNEKANVNTVNKRTAKTTMTDSEKIEEASGIVRNILEYFEYTTDTTADDVMDAIDVVLGDEFEGSVEWDEPYVFENATLEKAGYVHCFVKVKLGDLERRVGTSLAIPKLVTLLEEAVKLVSVAFDNGVYTNETTEAALLNTLQNSVSGVNGVTVEFVDGTFKWKPATAFSMGKIEVEIVLKRNADSVNVPLTKSFRGPVMSDEEKLAEAIGLATTSLENFTCTNSTTEDDIMQGIGIVAPEISWDWDADKPFTMISATKYEYGLISGQIIVKVGDATDTIIVNKRIARLPRTEEENISMAKEDVSILVQQITFTNEITADEIMNDVKAKLDSDYGAELSWSIEPVIKKATKKEEGTVQLELLLTIGDKVARIYFEEYIPKLPLSEDEKMEAAVEKASEIYNSFAFSNETTADDLLNAVKDVIFTEYGVTVSWDTDPIIVKATKEVKGSINATMLFTTSSKSTNKVYTFEIPKLPLTDEEMIEKAKTVAETAINDITVTNTKTTTDILTSIETALNSVTVIYNVAWDTNSPKVMYATMDKAGYLKGTIVMTVRGIDVKLNVDKVIAKLPITDENKVYTASAFVKDMLSVLNVSNSTKANNILALARESYQSVDGVYIAWKANSYAITPATIKNAGSIVGTLVLYCGNVTTEIKVDKTISKLSTNPDTKPEQKPTLEKPIMTISNNDSIYLVNSKNDLTMTCSGKLEDLVAIYVNDKILDASNYMLKSGSTILTLKESYLSTLSSGKYTLKFQYKDDISAVTYFTVVSKTDEVSVKPNLPQTDDNSNILLFIGLTIFMSCTMVYIDFKKRIS